MPDLTVVRPIVTGADADADASVRQRLATCARGIVDDLRSSTPADAWPWAADRELHTLIDLVESAGLTVASVCDADVVAWRALATA